MSPPSMAAPELGYRGMPGVADVGRPISLVEFAGGLRDWCRIVDGPYPRFPRCTSLSECFSLCSQNAGCKSFTYWPEGPECDFKRKCIHPGDERAPTHDGVVTYFKDCAATIEIRTTASTTSMTPPPQIGATLPPPDSLTAAFSVFGVVLVGALGVACGVPWYCRRRKAPPPSDLEGGSTTAPSSADAGAAGAPLPDVNVHHVVRPDRWCVTPRQLLEFLEQVQSAYPDEDPSAYKVVTELIKPRTAALSCSWALMANPEGVEVTHFVTHAWAEGVKSFCRSVLERIAEGGVWICFLANPQTWTSDDLGQLLGVNPFQSPFFLALSRASEVLVVRNDRVNLYTRLWCVFELWAANIEGVPIVPAGSNPPSIDVSAMGYNAVCSSERDTSMLRRAMRSRGSPDDINMWIGRVLFHS
uniref:Apple domain-containing protein n=1 Tax=Alexandrium monilatum TaxID=311494 RepID=A0A7S4W3I2_9DINO